VVIFVANELERKGFFPLLRAIASLKKSTVRLLAVGRLSERACAAEIAALGMTGRVRFTGPTSIVADYFAAADIFALPTYYEAWGLVIVEALACGLPVLTSRLAGASVAVQEGKNGSLLNQPSDEEEIREKLSALLAGKFESSAAISHSVAQFKWEHILPTYEATLHSCSNNTDLQSCNV
jgi:UDP-glucose:(heptosyl)LPS alpha-1,3-glucosyltransferase